MGRRSFWGSLLKFHAIPVTKLAKFAAFVKAHAKLVVTATTMMTARFATERGYWIARRALIAPIVTDSGSLKSTSNFVKSVEATAKIAALSATARVII